MEITLKSPGLDDRYVVFVSTLWIRGISRAEAELNAEAEVAQSWPNADRRRIKREIRKAIDRRRTWI